jgi:hypothetical protein
VPRSPFFPSIGADRARVLPRRPSESVAPL